MSTKLEVIADDNNGCGEGPTWDYRTGRLIWTDIPGCKVYSYEPATARKSVLFDRESIAGMALHASGGLVLAGAGGLHVLNRDGALHTLLTHHAGEQLNFNDILADPAGRLYAGTFYWRDGTCIKPGKLYLIDVDATVRVVTDGVRLSNGLTLSPDHRTLYHADSAARLINAYDVAPRTGTLSDKRPFVRVPDDQGMPDGLTLDSEGFLWCAQWFGGCIVRYDPEGREHQRINVPARQVSSLAFGGPDLKDLYLTTASAYAPNPLEPRGFDPNAPMGGALYRIRAQVAGRRANLARIPASTDAPPPQAGG
jgi:D-xylonolactonase